MSPPAEDSPSYPVIHVLVSDSFFWDKVEGTLRALEKQPVSPDWEGDAFEQVVANPGSGAVIDLEDEKFNSLELLQQMRGDKRTKDLKILAYCSHLRIDLIDAATEMKVDVVPRSTFAANLVRLLMELAGPAESADQGKNS